MQAQLSRRTHQLSGGTARLLHALLLLHADTAFSLFDEPFTGIMPVHIETLADEMHRLKRRKSLLLTDHRYLEMLPLCDVSYLLHHGRLLKLGADLRAELQKHGYVAA